MKIFVTSLILFLPSMVNAEVFEKVDIAHDKSYGYQVTNELARKGGTSERFEVRHGDCKGEDCDRDRQRYEVGMVQPHSTEDNWYSWSFYLPNNSMIQPAGTAIGQAKLIDGRVLWMVLTKHTDYIQIASDTYEQKCNLIKVDDAIEKWTDIMIRANYSSSSKKPLDVWINGKNVGCNYTKPLIDKKGLQATRKYKKGFKNEVAFKYGIYQSFISRWLDKHKTKETSGDVDISKWTRPSGKCCKSPDNTPFNEDWGVETPTVVMYYDEVKVGKARDDVNTLYDNSILDAKNPALRKEKVLDGNSKALKFIMDPNNERWGYPSEVRLGHNYITYSSPKNSYGYKASDKFSRIGDTSERFELRHGDCTNGEGGKYFSTCANDRQKFRRQVLIPINSNDSEIWYSWSFYLPKNFIKGFMIQPAGTAMGASTLKGLKHPRSKWQVLIKNTDWIQFATGSSPDNKCNLVKINDAVDKWTDIMVRTDWSPSSNNPIDVWINGKNVGCAYNIPLTTEKDIKNRNKKGLDNIVNFTYGIYQTYVSRWLDKHKTKETSGDINNDTSREWLTPSGDKYRSPDRTPFNEDWGVELPTAVMHYDAIRVGYSRDAVNLFYDDFYLNLPPRDEQEVGMKTVKSPLFDGRYSFDLFRYHDYDDWRQIGRGFVEIRNGEATIDKNSDSRLKTGSTDLYNTFSGQIDKNGIISASIELDILKGKDRTETYHLNGQIDEEIWGDSPREDFYRIYMLLVKE